MVVIKKLEIYKACRFSNHFEFLSNTYSVARIIVPLFEENGIFILGVVFFSQFSAIKITIVNKKFLDPVEEMNPLKSNVKRYFTSNHFLENSCSLKIAIANLTMLWTNLCAIRTFYS